MKNKVIISKIKTLNELKEVGRIVIESFASEIHSHIPELENGGDVENVIKFVKRYTSRIKSKVPFIIYIAELNEQIIGIAGGKLGTQPYATDELWGCEDFWYVKKEHRGGRAGILLFNKLIKWFKDNGAKRIQMTHYTWNPKVAQFYAKKGFKPFEINYVYKVGE